MRRKIITFTFLIIAAVAISAAAALLGPGLGPAESARALLRLLGGGDLPREAHAILLVRLTRLGAAACVGVALATAGTSLQAVLRNPLADPYILGIAAGGGFGAAVATAAGLGGGVAAFSAINLCAFGGALCAVGVGVVVARAAGILSVHALLLAGVVVGAFFTSLILLILAIVPARDQHAVFLWLMGDLANPDITPAKVAFAAVLVGLCSALLLALARPLDLIALGEETAFHLGLRVERFKVLILACASLATAAVVALAGPIGFVGLVVPHALRRTIGPRHWPLMAAAALGGAALVAAGDTLVRTTADYFEMPIVPVGVFTALIGAPYFLAILRRRRY
ncbi:MAG: iron ABC transporter permease [Candidatus Coatesbacteria bacterium]|nr:MAG: iron ABC transporter permease [Candidatus Coatesbacteria bacterium]